MTIALIIGHSTKYKGAVNDATGLYENDINVSLVNDIAKKLTVPFVIIKRGTIKYKSYRNMISTLNASNVSMFISFHSNAFNARTTGCETLYADSSPKSKKMAGIIQKMVATTMGNANRGTKPRTKKSLGGPLLHRSKMKGVIVEPFFIDSDEDFTTFCSKYTQLVEDFSRLINNNLGL